MSNARNIASGAKYVDTAGDNMTGDLTISSTAGQLKLTDTDGTEQNTTIKQSGGNLFIQSRDNTNNAGVVFAGNGGGNYSEHMRINASGRVTMPHQPAFCAQGSPTVTNSVIHSYGSELFNTGSHYNNSTGKFTAPVDGKYFFTCTIWPSGTMDANNTYLAFYQNDSTERTGSHGATNRQGITISSVLSMSANDTMLVKMLGSWSRQGSFPRNNFSGFLVG